MNIVINRTRIKGEYCEGYLIIDGSARICSTLENANGLAPAGDYPITLVKCKQYARKMPLLDLSGSLSSSNSSRGSNLSNPSDLSNRCGNCHKLPFVCTNSTLPCWCPMIKPGNGVHDRLDGSICVGQYNCLNSLLHPRTTFDPLYERIRKSISRGNQVMLSIKDPLHGELVESTPPAQMAFSH